MTDPLSPPNEDFVTVVFLTEGDEVLFELFNPNEYPEELKDGIQACSRRYASVVHHGSNTIGEIQRYRKLGWQENLDIITGFRWKHRTWCSFECPNVFADFEAFLISSVSLLDVLVKYLLSHKAQRTFRGFKGENRVPGAMTLKDLKKVSNTILPTKEELIALIEQNKELWIDGVVMMRNELVHEGRFTNVRGFWMLVEHGESKSFESKDIHDPELMLGNNWLRLESYCREVLPLIKKFTACFRDLLFPLDEREKLLKSISQKAK